MTSRSDDGWITPQRGGWITDALRIRRRGARGRWLRPMLASCLLIAAGIALAMSGGGRVGPIEMIGDAMLLIGVALLITSQIAYMFTVLREAYLAIRDARREGWRVGE